MTRKTWVKPTVTPLAAAKDAQQLGSVTADLLGKGSKSS